jgi:hypothetical protein
VTINSNFSFCVLNNWLGKCLNIFSAMAYYTSIFELVLLIYDTYNNNPWSFTQNASVNALGLLNTLACQFLPELTPSIIIQGQIQNLRKEGARIENKVAPIALLDLTLVMELLTTCAAIF